MRRARAAAAIYSLTMRTGLAKMLKGPAGFAGLLAVVLVAGCEDPLAGPSLDASSAVEPRSDASPGLSDADDVHRDAGRAAPADAPQADGPADAASGDEPHADGHDASPEATTELFRDAAVDRRPDVAIDRAPDSAVDAAPETVIYPTVDASWGLDGADGGAGARVVLTKSYAWADCMPSVGTGTADPIMVTWTVDISGVHGDTARVSKATLTVVGAVTIVQDFPVDKPTIALVAGAGSAEQRKPVPGTLPNAACTQICSMSSPTSRSYRLDLVFDVDGQSIAVQASGSFTCAY